MANGHGGARTPANPAPVSGPGAMSRRTDGAQPTMELPDARYGEAATFRQDQQGAPMAQTGNMPANQQAPSWQGSMDISGLTGLGEPTQMPDQSVMTMAPQPREGSTLDDKTRARLAAALPVLLQIASQPDADPNTRAYVTNLRANL